MVLARPLKALSVTPLDRDDQAAAKVERRPRLGSGGSDSARGEARREISDQTFRDPPGQRGSLKRSLRTWRACRS